MHRYYTAAIWGSLGVILLGLAMVFGVWAVVAVALGVGVACAVLYIFERREPRA